MIGAEDAAENFMPFLTVPKQKFGMFVKSAQPLMRGGATCLPKMCLPGHSVPPPLPPTPLNILHTITEFWNAWYNA